MKKLYTLLCFSIGLMGCSDKEEIAPSSILRMKIDGRTIAFTLDSAVIRKAYSDRKSSCLIYGSADKKKTRLVIGYGQRTYGVVDEPHTYDTSTTYEAAPMANYTCLITDYDPPCGVPIAGTKEFSFSSYGCAPMSFELDVVQVDQSKQTISGTFSGMVGTNCDERPITDGVFSVPYTVRY